MEIQKILSLCLHFRIRYLLLKLVCKVFEVHNVYYYCYILMGGENFLTLVQSSKRKETNRTFDIFYAIAYLMILRQKNYL